jgi:hypothetical protein
VIATGLEVQALVLALAVSAAGGCRAKVAERDEAGPAAPCSVNGMLFRDTLATEFERCGVAELPLTGEVAECVKAAVQAQRPFVVELKLPRRLSLGRAQAAIVGAEFEGGYALRSYLGSEQEGERSTMDLIVTSPRASELALVPAAKPTLRCVQSEAPPAANDPGWRASAPAGPAGRHRFHPGRCLEWFDDAQWERQPWALAHDGERHLECAP